MTEEKKEITEQRTEQSPVREVNFTEFSENGE